MEDTFLVADPWFQLIQLALQKWRRRHDQLMIDNGWS